MIDFTDEQIERYSRNILLKDIGGEGQSRLLESSVLIIGAGGLGSPAAFYLAAAGVGHIGIIDHDVVDISNLQRQILFNENSIGKSKVKEAERTINEVNPDVKVTTYQERLSSDNIMNIIDGYDVILDGTDNFPTRYLLNDATVFRNKPVVHGSIYRFDGQVTVFYPKKGPCYRCLYPEPPPPGLVPSCQEGGVLGVLPGIIGTIQTTEVMKLILGIGEPLIGKLLCFDALDMQFRTMRLRKNPRCPVCGENPTITSLVDYNQFCGIPAGKR